MSGPASEPGSMQEEMPPMFAGTAADAVDGVVPAHVARPETTEAVRHLVRKASGDGHALVATGLGRHLTIGEPPARLDLLLRLDRLDRVREHEAADMTVTVEVGCPLATLERVLAGAQQWLPLDPPAPEATTVGGLIAANLSGPLRASQGTVRDLLLGLRWVSPDGDLVSAGGRVVKNVAGYDLAKAHVGAYGTLGVLVEATFKVRPRPPRERALVLVCDHPRAALEVALAARDAVEPGWLEIASPGLLAEAPEAPCVVVGWLGLAEEVADAEDRVRSSAAAAVHGRPRARALGTLDDDAAAGLRARLAGVALAPGAATLRAVTLPGALGALLADATRLAQDGGEPPCWAAHAASGIARIVVHEARNVAPFVAALRPRLEAAGGSLLVERAAPDIKHAIRELGGVFGDPGEGRALMQRLKDAFDPRRTLAPGRFVAGI